MKKCFRTAGVGGFCFLMASVFSVAVMGLVRAQTPPATETAGGLLQQQKRINEQKIMEQKAVSGKTKSKKAADSLVLPEGAGETTMIRKVIVEGITLISVEDVRKITASYEGRELSLREMQKIADLITDEYRRRGFMTSRAFIPPQMIRDATLILNVVEGKLGAVAFRGNRYFKTSMLRKKIDLRPRGYFDYRSFQNSLTYMNEHPDRAVKAVLVPGKERGTTDVQIDVKDRLPVHVGGSYDNYSSRYLGERKWTAFIEHNNLLGFDDKLRLEYQRSRDGSLRTTLGRYVFPVRRGLDLGAYFLSSDSELGREFEALGSKGSATVVGVYSNKMLIRTDAMDLRWSTGFDYKNAKNELLGLEMSEDDSRVLKTGLDLDFNDPWARNILITEIGMGLPDFMGGMKAKDAHSSRGSVGSGGRFEKLTLNYFRLQPGPLSTEILWKNAAQLSGSDLVAGEQFQIGGAGSVRGYPSAEYAGDSGAFSSVEWTLPFYYIPRDWKVPMTQRTLFQSLRLVTFYDVAYSHINTTLDGEPSDRALQGYGYGLRMNLGENFTARVEVGYHLNGDEPSNGKNAQPWFEMIAKF